jgi:6-phosphofructokinase 1
VANVEKMLPPAFITRDGYGITDKARAYLAPLIRGEDPPPFRDGLPQYVRLKNVAVPKKIGTDFKV